MTSIIFLNVLINYLICLIVQINACLNFSLFILVQEELVTVPEHLSSTRFTMVFVLPDLYVSLQSFIDRCLSFCLFLVIAFSVLLRCVASYYPFKVFVHPGVAL